jgi:hypothetical protein
MDALQLQLSAADIEEIEDGFLHESGCRARG